MACKTIFLCFIIFAASYQIQAAKRDDVLNYLRSISGSKTITGQHNTQHNGLYSVNFWTKHVEVMTGGKIPGLWGGDFSCWENEIPKRGEMIDTAIDQWNKGSLVTLTFNVCRPNIDEPCEFLGGVWVNETQKLTESDWQSLITNRMPLNERWKKRIREKYIPSLRKLKENGVVSILRPFQEINGGWFWWTNLDKPQYTIQLYRLTRNYILTFGLGDSIIWNWCVSEVPWGNSRPFSRFYPGPEHVDIATVDVYANGTDVVGQYGNYQAKDTEYEELKRTAPGKLLGLGEVGQIPSPETMRHQKDWVYFMVWGDYINNTYWNTHDDVSRTYWDNSRVLNQGELQRF